MNAARTGLQALLAAAAVAAAQPSAAVDAVATLLPATVDDGRISIGPRSLALPPGPWTLVARSEGQVRHGVEARANYFTVYAMQAEGGTMRAGVVTRLPVRTVPTDAWNEEPCNHGEGMFMDRVHSEDFGEPGRHCLHVFRHRTHLAGRNLDPFFRQARNWAAGAGVAVRGPFYEISYGRFVPKDFGWVRVIVPAAAFATERDAIAWARQLPPALRELFEHRATQAVLPALPKKDS
ncbi:MAG TPA: hypothetical protein VGD76_00265 [Ramlibacter sp.]